MASQNIAAAWLQLRPRTDIDNVVREIIGYYQTQLALYPQERKSITRRHLTWFKSIFDLQRLHLHKPSSRSDHLLHPLVLIACMLHLMRLRVPDDDCLGQTLDDRLALWDLLIFSGLRVLHLLHCTVTNSQKKLLHDTFMEKTQSLRGTSPIHKLSVDAIVALPIHQGERGPFAKPAGGRIDLNNYVEGLVSISTGMAALIY